MKKLNLFIGLLIGFMILSCSDDNDNPQQEPEETVKKLISESITTSHGNFERTFVYNSENKVTDINSVYTGDDQWTADLTNTTFIYEDNKITSATTHEDGELYTTSLFNYSNDQLIELIIKDANGIEGSKMEFNYNSQGKVNGFNYYVDQQLQHVMSFEYDAVGNLTNAEDGIDNYDFQFDQNTSAFKYFSYAEKIIFAYGGIYENISKNNMTSQTITYNANSTSEVIFYYNTTIDYDNENYPLNKTTIQTYNDTDSTLRTIVYEYE